MNKRIQRALSASITNTPAEWTLADIEAAVETQISEVIQPNILTPEEQAFGIMVLFSKYGVYENELLYTVTQQGFVDDLDAMFSTACSATLISAVETQLTENNTGSGSNPDSPIQRKQINYNTNIPVATRLARMPTPSAIIKLLATTINRELPTSPTNEEINITVENTLLGYKDQLWGALDPVQKTHLIVQTDDQYEGSYIETDQDYTDWQSVIDNAYLYHHLEGILRAGYDSIEILTDDEITLVEKQLRQIELSQP